MESHIEESEQETVTFTTPSREDLCGDLSLNPTVAQLVPPFCNLVFVPGLLGNTMVVLILIKYQQLRNTTSICLFNLATSDLLSSLTIPFWSNHLVNDRWIFGRSMCRLLSMFYFLGLYSEAFFIVLLTVDRYLAIAHAMSALRVRTVTFGVVTSVVTWSLAVLAALPEIIFHDFSGKSFCTTTYPKNEEVIWLRFRALRMNVLDLALPLLVMGICYSEIIKTLLRCPDQRKYTAIRLICIIVVVFSIFWAPRNLVFLFCAFENILRESREQLQRMDLALLMTKLVALIHYCINPVIYAFVSENFQQHLRQFSSHMRSRPCADASGSFLLRSWKELALPCHPARISRPLTTVENGTLLTRRTAIKSDGCPEALAADQDGGVGQGHREKVICCSGDLE
ncbi:C-C chemokine receptor type 3-like [Ctenodactylus gundi]